MNVRMDGELWRVVHVKQYGLHNISIPTILWQSVLEEAYSVSCHVTETDTVCGMDGADCLRKLLCVTWVQVVRWDKGGTVRERDYDFFYGK